MKKLINYTLLLGSVIALASCSAEDPTIAKNDYDKVSLTVQLPTQNTTRFNDGKQIDQLYYTILDKTGAEVLDSGMQPWEEGIMSQKITLDLVPGQEYQVVFFADTKDAESKGYTYSASTASLSIDYDAVEINNDNYDAFYKIVPGISTATSSNTAIVLTRPFAQINIGTKGFDNNLVSACIDKYTTEFSLASTNLASGVSFLNGAPSYTAATKGFTKTVTDLTATKALTDAYPVGGYNYLDMMYLLVNPDATAEEGKAVLGGSFNVSLTDNGVTTPVQNIPLLNMPAKENYQTNIYGSLLTDAKDLTISIDPSFGEGSPYTYLEVPDTAVPVTDNNGNAVNGLYVDTDAKTLYTGSPEALAYINQNWNTLFKNAKYNYYSITLYSDIDFTGYTWACINTNSDNCHFNGIDGQGCTIRNMTIGHGSMGSAMFWGPGCSNLPEGNYIRNLNLENVTVNSGNDYHAGIFICQTYGDWVISNVNVNKATITGTYDIGTFVGRVYNDSSETGRSLTMTNVSAKDVTIVSNAPKLTGYRFDDNVGCVVGFVDEGRNCTASFTNVTIDGLDITAPEGFTVVTDGYQYTTDFPGSIANSSWAINTNAGITTSNVKVTYTK